MSEVLHEGSFHSSTVAKSLDHMQLYMTMHGGSSTCTLAQERIKNRGGGRACNSQ